MYLESLSSYVVFFWSNTNNILQIYIPLSVYEFTNTQ